MKSRTPTNISERRSFLGMMNYSRKFIENYAEICKPLLTLLKKDVKWIWGETQEQAMIELKIKLTQAPCLAYPERGKPFYLETGFTDLSMSAVLCQKQDDQSKIIAYASKSLSPQTSSPYKAYDEEYCSLLPRVYIDGCAYHAIVGEERKLVAGIGITWTKEYPNISVGYNIEYVTNSFVEYLPGWKRNDMLRSNNKPVKHADLFGEIEKMVTENGLTEGNDLADKLAKQGLCLRKIDCCIE
uniref:Reverse transcriptase/retrotransposon-derived protein RNase H-like domain-containing protein n=1 Tax=Leptobrachium leishanense TaxID=445787 RepID=A0A8C5QSF0_9ANUR